METIGKRIEELRYKNNLTLDDLSKHLGISKTAVRKYETGATKNIKYENVEKLAQLFNVSVDYLLNGTKEETEEDRLIKLLIQKTIDDKIEWSFINPLDNKSIDFIEYNITFNELIKLLNIYCDIENSLVYEIATTKLFDKNFVVVALGAINKACFLIYGKNIYNASLIEDNQEILNELYRVIFDKSRYMEQQELKSIISDLENL